MSKKFKLSKVLFGHSLDVRCVTTTPDDSIISGSRDKTAKLWIPNKAFGTYNEAMTYRDQKNFVVSVLYLEANQEFPDGVIITGSNDFAIYLYRPSEPFATKTLKIHTNTVSCLSKGVEKGTFLSGSWDCTARLWNLNDLKDSVVLLTGHKAAIWDVIQLSNSRIVTASADKTVILWTNSGEKLKTLTGHTDCVRGLADVPQLQQFLSVANDASIRLWTYNGDNLATYYGHTNYIYSIAVLPISTSCCFVTSDEDRTVRFWDNGINIDTFQLPAQSVWSVACLTNGDIVTGSSDGVVRIFTQDINRYADETTLNKFEEEVENITRQSVQEIGGYKVSDLPGKEALFDPGKKPGQMKMIREDNKVVAYTWIEDGGNSHWEKVGDVLGSTDKNQSDKTMYEGKAYDFVFSVDVEDGKPPLKLPFNINDDPYKAANEFLIKNNLPSAYLEQVVDFILKNAKQQSVPISNDYVDPFTGASRYTPNTNQTQATMVINPDPFTGDSSYTTVPTQTGKYFPITVYRTFDNGDLNIIFNKLKEFKMKSNSEIEEKQLEDLVKICNGPPVDPNSFDVLFKLLEWPDELVFPVLDVIRMAVRHQKNNEIIVSANNGILIQKLLYFINGESKFPNNIIVALRTLCNLFCHESGEHLVYEHRFDIVENITTLHTLNKSGQTALATLLLNLTVATIKRKDDLSSSVLADVLPDMLTTLTESEPQFRGFVALGTLITSSTFEQIDEIRSKIKQNLKFLKVLETTTTSMNIENKNKDCAKELLNCLKQVK